MRKKYSPAAWVIKVFGGVRPAGRALGRSHAAVSKWTAKYGSNGRVPSGMQSVILKTAKKLKLDITAEDLVNGRTA